MTKRALVIINPLASRADSLKHEVLSALTELGVSLVHPPVENPQQFPAIIEHYHQQVDLVVVGGGDGTLNTTLGSLLSTGLPLGILPLGTANNLARNLNIPLDIPNACRIIAQGHCQLIDVGKVNGHYFLNVVGIGLSGEINRQVDRHSKKFWGVLAYGATALKVIQKARHFRATIHHQGQTVEKRTLQVTVCNGRYYGSGLVIAHDATIDDAHLDLYGFGVQRWWDILPLLPGMINGKYEAKRNIFVYRGKEMTIETFPPKRVDVDGEVIGMTPAKFEVLPKALSVMVEAKA